MALIVLECACLRERKMSLWSTRKDKFAFALGKLRILLREGIHGKLHPLLIVAVMMRLKVVLITIFSPVVDMKCFYS